MIKINNTIQRDAAHADGNDILNVKKALFRTGDYDIPDYGLTAYPDQQMFSAIKKFQKNNGLKVDGVIETDGETLNALNGQHFLGDDDPDPKFIKPFANGKRNLTPSEPLKSPIMRCPQCGAPHGGSAGDLCPDCDAKS